MLLGRIMRATAISICCGVLLFACYATGQRSFTNKVERAVAIKVASRLAIGMREEAAASILERNDLRHPIRVGDSFGWTRFYTLADGTALGVEFDSIPARPPEWTNGVLRAAFIQSN